jgi:hypothetical protein
MDGVGIFYDHLVYFTAIGNILWPFGIFYGHFGIFFPRFGMLYQEKSGNPDLVNNEPPLENFFPRHKKKI